MANSKLFIATEPQGHCYGCGLVIDSGEWVAMREGLACHAKTCSPRQRAAHPALQPTGLLFADPQLEVMERSKEVIGATEIRFDGVSARPVDLPRLAGQIRSVFDLMRDGRYRSLATIAEKVGGLETSAGRDCAT